jgi:TolB-like protein
MKPIKLMILLLAFVSITAGQDNEAKAGRNTIAVNSLQAKGISADEADVLTSKLRSEIARSGKFRMLERSQMDEILKEQGFQKTGLCDEASCAVEIGQLLGVSHMVAGSIGKVGSTFAVSARLFSVSTGEIIKDVSLTHKGSIDKLLDTKMAEVAEQLCDISSGKKSSSRGWIYLGVGVVAVAGAGAAYVLLGDDNSGTGSQTTDNVSIQVGW